MRYEFYLYDITNSDREAVFHHVENARINSALVGEDILSLTVSPYNELGEHSLGVEPVQFGNTFLIREKKYIRVYDIAAGGYQSYMILKVSAKRQDNRVLYDITAEHIKYAAQDKTVPLKTKLTSISVDELMTLALSHVADFTLNINDIPSTELRDIDLEYPTLLGLLNQIIDLWSDSSIRYYYKIDNSKYIDILSESNIGEEKNFVLTNEHNLNGIVRTSDASNMANRIFAYSDDGNRLDYADSIRYKDNTLGSALYIGDSETTDLDGGAGADSNNVTNGSIFSIRIASWFIFNTPYAGYANMEYEIELLDSDDNIIWGGTEYISEDAIASVYSVKWKWINIHTGDLDDIKKVKVTCSTVNTYGGASINVAYLQVVELWYELGPNVKYVKNTSSQTDHGEIDAPKKLEYPRVLNLISNYKDINAGIIQELDSTLSGTYFGGTAEGWALKNISGFSSVSENTDTDYIMNGSKSQHIVLLTAGYLTDYFYAYEDFIGLVKDESYFSIFNIYIKKGTLKIRVYDDEDNNLFVHETSGRGWIEVRNEDPFSPSDNSSIHIKISSVSKNANFYLDSVQIAKGLEQMDFYKANSADEMKLKAQSLLNINCYPRYVYQVKMQDYSIYDPLILSESYDVGDSIRIIDDEIPLNTTLRVIKIDKNLLDPQDINMELSNRTEPLYNLVSKIADQKNLLAI